MHLTRKAVLGLACLLAGVPLMANVRQANPYVGSWAVTTPGGQAGWIGVAENAGKLSANIMWIGGSVVLVDHRHGAHHQACLRVGKGGDVLSPLPTQGMGFLSTLKRPEELSGRLAAVSEGERRREGVERIGGAQCSDGLETGCRPRLRVTGLRRRGFRRVSRHRDR